VPASGIEQGSEVRFEVAPGKEMLNNVKLCFAGALKASEGILAGCEVHDYSPIVWDWGYKFDPGGLESFTSKSWVKSTRSIHRGKK
jgi:hypothetical protein